MTTEVETEAMLPGAKEPPGTARGAGTHPSTKTPRDSPPCGHLDLRRPEPRLQLFPPTPSPHPEEGPEPELRRPPQPCSSRPSSRPPCRPGCGVQPAPAFSTPLASDFH